MRKKQDITKRPTPDHESLDWREKYLTSVQTKDFDTSYENAPLLEPGNSKIGRKSKDYDRVYVWNLPVVITCPGASKWCLRHCYNADPRIEKFPIDKWHRNLQFYLMDPETLEKRVLEILNEPEVIKAVRIHSSGDFFEVAYIEFWRRIATKTPLVKYWAYTRSWQDPTLLSELETLRSLKNVQIFASWDKSMPNTPPSGWRKSFVYQVDESIAETGIICPEQSGMSPNCATCNYCIQQGNGDVYFILH